MFTPALVVNGETMLVGSNQPGIEQAIKTARVLPVALRAENGAVQVGAVAAPVTLLFAALDPEQETAVAGGENGGRRLTEYQVVRESRVLASWDGDPRSVPLPKVAAGRRAVVLLQSAELKVLGAARVN